MHAGVPWGGIHCAHAGHVHVVQPPAGLAANRLPLSEVHSLLTQDVAQALLRVLEKVRGSRLRGEEDVSGADVPVDVARAIELVDA